MINVEVKRSKKVKDSYTDVVEKSNIHPQQTVDDRYGLSKNNVSKWCSHHEDLFQTLRRVNAVTGTGKRKDREDDVVMFSHPSARRMTFHGQK